MDKRISKKLLLCFTFILLSACLSSCKEYKAKAIITVNTNISKDTESVNSKLHINNYEINIDGLNSEYKFLFITDSHVINENREDLGWFGSTDKRGFKDSNSISSADNFPLWISYANNHKVNALIMGGDIIDYLSNNNVRFIKSKLKSLKTQWIYTLGNHDSYIPWKNRFNNKNNGLSQLLIKGDYEVQVLDEKEFFIVAVKDYATNGTASISQKAFKEFKKIYEKCKPIILVMHVPLNTDHTGSLKKVVNGYFGKCFLTYDADEFGKVSESLLMGENCGYKIDNNTKKFIKLITKEDGPVKTILAGHIHQTWQGKINKSVSEYIGPAAYMDNGTLITIKSK